MQRIISRAVVAVLAAFAILTPTGYAMTDPGLPQAAEKHDAQLQFVDPQGPSTPAPDKHDAKLERAFTVERAYEQPLYTAAEKHDAQLDKVIRSGIDVTAYGTDVAAADQQASQPVGGRSALATSPVDDDGGLSTAAITALIALVAMSGIAVASVAHRHARVRV